MISEIIKEVKEQCKIIEDEYRAGSWISYNQERLNGFVEARKLIINILVKYSK